MREFSFRKRGMSGIIITVIMIALALVMIGVVWAVISNIVSESSEDTETTASQLFSTAAELGFVKMEKGQDCYGTEVVCKDGLACDGIVPDQIPGLIGYWSFDGDAQDNSGEGNHLTLYNNPQYVNGVAGDALDFEDSLLQYGLSPAITMSEDITLSRWFSPESFTANSNCVGIIRREGNTNRAGFAVEVRATFLRIIVSVAPSVVEYIDIPYTFTAGNEYHIVVAYDSSSSIFYSSVDGTLISTDSSTQMIQTGNLYFVVGRRYEDYNGYYTDGIEDELRLYNRALTEEEIAALYEFP